MLISLRNFALSLLISLAVFGLAAYFIVTAIAGAVTPADEPPAPPPTTGSEVAPPTDTTGPDTAAAPANGGATGSVTLLLAGLDSGESQYDGKPETDIIALVNINNDTKKIMCTSIPCNMIADSGVQGYKIPFGRIYGDLGIDALTGAVRAYTGLGADYYFVADYEGLQKLFELLGPVKYNVPVKMYLKPIEPEEPAEGAQPAQPAENAEPPKPEIDLKAGTQDLSPEQVLQLLRYRGYSNGERERINTFRSFLQEVVKQKLNISLLPKAQDIFEQLKDTIKTNMTSADVLKNLEILNNIADYASVDLDYPTTNGIDDLAGYVIPQVPQAVARYKPYRTQY